MKEASFLLILVLMVAHFQSIESVCTIDCVGSGGTVKGSICEFVVVEELPVGSTIVSLAFSADACTNPTLEGDDAATYFETSGNHIVMKRVVDYEEDTTNLPHPIFFEVECPSGPCIDDSLVIQVTNVNDNPIMVSENSSTAEVWELITYPAGDPLDVTPKIYAIDVDVESYLLYTIKDRQSPFRLVDSEDNTACFHTYNPDGSINTESPILQVSESHVFDYRYQSSYKLTVLVQSFLGGYGCSDLAVETVEYSLVINVRAIDVPRCECVCQCCNAAPDIQNRYRDQESKP